MKVFEDVPPNSSHFIKAAEFCNICMAHGTQGSNTDFFICSVAYLEHIEIFTNDDDFINYKKHLPIELFVR
jgi:hypothetical protein